MKQYVVKYLSGYLLNKIVMKNKLNLKGVGIIFILILLGTSVNAQDTIRTINGKNLEV